MGTRWMGWLAAVVAIGLGCALIALDVADSGIRHWWDMHSFTTDTISGLVVLLITVLVVDQVVQLRQNKNRSVATAAQAAILMAQADRSSRAVSAVFDGSGDRDAASNEVRNFMTLVLIAAPVLMDPEVARRFLEQSQRLSAELVRALHEIGQDPSATTAARDRVDAAVEGLRNASQPVVQTLNAQQRAAAAGWEHRGAAAS